LKILVLYKDMRISNIKIVDDDKKSVTCSGDKNTGAHPQIYLNLRDDDGTIECYYCGKIFIWKSFFSKKKT